MANTNKLWKGAVEIPDNGTATGNTHLAWKGAVEPTETAAATGGPVAGSLGLMGAGISWAGMALLVALIAQADKLGI